MFRIVCRPAVETVKKSHFAMNKTRSGNGFGVVAFFASLAVLVAATAQSQTYQVGSLPSSLVADTGEGAGGMSLLTRLPVHLSLTVRSGYDDNLLGGTGSGSWFTDGGASLSYKLSNERTTLNLDSGAHVTYYPAQSGGHQADDLNIYLTLTGSEHVNSRVKVDVNALAAYQTEPDFSSNVGVENRRADYFQTSDSASVHYSWSSRFSTVLGDSLQRVQYESSSIGSTQDRFDDTISCQLQFHLLPEKTSLIGEYRFEVVRYDTLSGGDSLTHYGLVGIDETFNPQLKATVRGGATLRTFDDGGSRTDPHFEGSLSYAGAHHSTLSWTSSYGVEQPNVAGVLSRVTFRTGLQVKYDLTSRISATFDGFYHHDKNEGTIPSAVTPSTPTSGFSENAFDLALTGRYAIKGFLTFDVTVDHSQLASSTSSQNYSRNRYSAGFTFTY
jgi:Putative beta-barrel porin 2